VASEEVLHDRIENYHGDASLHSARGTADADGTGRIDRACAAEAYTIVGTNAIGAIFPVEIPMYYAVEEVLEATPEGRASGYKHESPYIGHAVVDSGVAAPTGGMTGSYSPQRELEIINTDTAIELENTSLLIEENEAVCESDTTVCNDSNPTIGHVRFLDRSGNERADEARYVGTVGDDSKLATVGDDYKLAGGNAVMDESVDTVGDDYKLATVGDDYKLAGRAVILYDQKVGV
jgi:hypothetical protein